MSYDEDRCDLCGDPLRPGQEYAHPECVHAWQQGDDQPPDHHTDGRVVETVDDRRRRFH